MSIHEMNTSTGQIAGPRSDGKKNGGSKPNDHNNKIKKCMKINKPMIPLKISLFLWYGGGAVIIPFFNLYILQLGISMSQFSFMLALNPIIQFAGPTISGIIADKIGRSKPVLFGNLVLTALVTNSILLVPAIATRKCFIEDVAEIQCNPNFSVKSLKNESRYLNSSLECFVQCNSNQTLYHTFTLDNTNAGDDPSPNNTFPVPDTLNSTFYATDNELSSGNATWTSSKTFCRYLMEDDCESFCGENIRKSDSWMKMHCPHVEDNSALVITVCTIISCLFSAVISNCYRFMDVTTMFMVKAHNSDFGRERFWSMLSITLMSPFASYLIDLTTVEGQPRNCATAIYFIDVIIVLLMIAVYKLDVQIYPPGRDMIKNTLKLMKNLDVMAFGVSLLIIGSSNGFTRIYSFIYLDRLGSPSILMGLMLGVNSICGLPFLLTSNWWIGKIGSSNLLLCAFLGYVFLCLGYSFLENAWHALIFETSSIFTYHLLWVAVVRHSHEIAPEGLTATVIACAGGIHWALGKGVGSLIGGQVMSKYGGRWAFRLIAIICGFSFIIYAAFLYIRRNKVIRKEKLLVLSKLRFTCKTS